MQIESELLIQKTFKVLFFYINFSHIFRRLSVSKINNFHFTIQQNNHLFCKLIRASKNRIFVLLFFSIFQFKL